MIGVLALVIVGLAMTALMQSSTAAVAVTLSGYFAGAVGLDQACALIIGQNIGTATSSALAAIGTSTTAKRLAIAYVLFKLIAAAIALALFPVVTPLLVRASSTIDGATLLAGYHTAYNVVGVLVLLPLVDRFTRLVERILPERGSPLTRCLDRSALATPMVAVEAVRRTIARALAVMCGSVETALLAATRGEPVRPGKDAISVHEAAAALRQAQVFLSDVAGPPDSDDEQQRLTSTLHALDHASRMAETASGEVDFGTVRGGPDDARAGQLCADAMRSAASVASEVEAPSVTAQSSSATLISRGNDASSAATVSTEEALARLKRCAAELAELQLNHRSATLGAVANGTLTADVAIARVDTLRSFEALAHHAWRSVANLAGAGK
jgi:phosphate:Na+ symporter